MKELINSFDVASYLQDKGIDFTESGKNVSYGWIGINCLYCNDPSNHLGINLESKTFNCWNCNETGTIVKLVMEIENITFKQSLDILEEYSTLDIPLQTKKYRTKKEIELLPEISEKLDLDKLPKIVSRYLEKRKFDRTTISRYNLRFCDVGEFPLSIIAPITCYNEIVSWQSLDLTGKRFSKYISAKNIKNYLYNLDNAKRFDQIIICEGITDVWNINERTGAIACFSKTMTDRQLALFIDNVDSSTKIKIVFDPDAYKNAMKLYEKINAFFDNVLVVRLSTNDGDPGSLTSLQINKLISL